MRYTTSLQTGIAKAVSNWGKAMIGKGLAMFAVMNTCYASRAAVALDRRSLGQMSA